MEKKLKILYFLLFIVLLCSCDTTKHPFADDIKQKEILVYSGMTMIQPVMEVADVVEQEKDCKVLIVYGGSGHIRNSVEINRVGDIFFPGTVSFIHELERKGVVVDYKTVGHNYISLFVKKGNPKGVKPDIKEVLRPDLSIVLPAEKSGAIGRAVKESLVKLGIWEKTLTKSRYLTVDSKGLAQAMKNGDADLVINFHAVYYLKDNSHYMDVILLSTDQARRHPLVMGLLAFSKEQNLAQFFLEKSVSIEGQKIFEKFGF